MTPGFNKLIVLPDNRDYRVSADEDAAQWEAIKAKLIGDSTNPHEIASISYAVDQMRKAIGGMFVRKDVA